MPIYEYECEGCGKHFEVYQKIADEPLTECRVCKGRLNKLISQCSFHLKGTGWYVTDYKKPVDSGGRIPSSGNGSKEAEKTETKSDTKPEVPAETKTETKADTKTETKSAESTGG
ncbi:MAG: Zinc ribbon domain protein [Syntrophorhabdus sp. PtaU1.Bin002]|nr:MAG: Zinc ribbon domain protein [Syntrophorhabdus sp. PtaB.Bin006]OPY72363.1 MAG: Zinc ribbon domain protein [Syntrophorhabdus sp. PtaU1.Bin002]